MSITMEPLACKLCGERFTSFADMRPQAQTFHYGHRLFCDRCDIEEVTREMQAEREYEAWLDAGEPMGWWRQ